MMSDICHVLWGPCHFLCLWSWWRLRHGWFSCTFESVHRLRNLLIGGFDQADNQHCCCDDDNYVYCLISKQLLKVVTDTVVTTTTTTTVEEKYKVTMSNTVFFQYCHSVFYQTKPLLISMNYLLRFWHRSQCKRHSCRILRTKEVISTNLNLNLNLRYYFNDCFCHQFGLHRLIFQRITIIWHHVEDPLRWQISSDTKIPKLF